MDKPDVWSSSNNLQSPWPMRPQTLKLGGQHSLPVSGWQPIETAPKDGTSALLHDADGRMIVGWFHPGGRWMYVTQDGAPLTVWGPTHWMPLPEPPTA